MRRADKAVPAFIISDYAYVYDILFPDLENNILILQTRQADHREKDPEVKLQAARRHMLTSSPVRRPWKTSSVRLV